MNSKNRTKKKTKKSTRKSYRRASKTTCRALIPLDTKKIRKEFLKVYKRRKKVLDKIESQLEQYTESDEPEFQKFLALRFGTEQSKLRELAEKLSLAQLRREKLRHMASEESMAQGKYCAYLESKVTSGIDFWTVLENEILEMHEEQRQLDEEFERYCKECNDGDCDDDYEEELDKEFEGMFEKDIKSLFDDLFSDILPESENLSSNNKKDLKKLYRELCFRYHPDKTGEHDLKTRRLWLAIQDAYNDGNLARLRTIHAEIELEAGKIELPCSDIDTMTGEIEWSIRMARNQLRKTKKTPYWGFSTWTAKKRKQAEQELVESYRYDLEITEHQLRKKEAEIERIRNSYRIKKKNQNINLKSQPNLLQLELPF